MSMAASFSTTPTVSTAPSPSGPLRCAVTPDATPSATINAVSYVLFDPPVTINAGQAVAFTNQDTEAHTITEGTAGIHVDHPCVDQRIEAGATSIVTFDAPATYQITCTLHPGMNTSVIVQ